MSMSGFPKNKNGLKINFINVIFPLVSSLIFLFRQSYAKRDQEKQISETFSSPSLKLLRSKIRNMRITVLFSVLWHVLGWTRKIPTAFTTDIKTSTTTNKSTTSLSSSNNSNSIWSSSTCQERRKTTTSSSSSNSNNILR